MATRGVGMTIQYRCWDTSANGYKTGDVANHTLRWVKDGTAGAPSNSPSEIDATNAPGIYKLELTASETDCNIGDLVGKSSTGNVVIIGPTIQFERLPDAAPGVNGGVAIVDANNLIAGIQGTVTTFDALIAQAPTLEEIEAEVEDALAVARTEPASQCGHTGDFRQKIDDMYQIVFTGNKKIQTASLWTLRNEADSADVATATISYLAGVLTLGG